MFFRTHTSKKSSTPKICTRLHSDRSGTTTYSMSQGLAAILNERDLLKTPPEGTVPKTVQTHSGNPARFPSLVSDSHYSNIDTSVANTPVTMSSSGLGTVTSPSTLTSRFQVPMSRSQTTVSTEIKTTAEDSSNGNVIDRIRNTGFTIYGLLSGAGPSSNTTRPNTLPVGSSGIVTMATGSNTITTATGSVPSVSTDNLVTVGTVTEGQGKSGLGSIFTHNTAGGVIGALANFKRNGIL